MANNPLTFLRVSDYIQRAKDPKCIDIIVKEHLQVINLTITSTCDIFYLPRNRRKNRNMKYPCWDISRVVLKSNNGSDYINANYMAGIDGRCKFIATQEPMATTFDDFWSMIWQENSRIIVMLNGTKQESQPTSPQYFCIQWRIEDDHHFKYFDWIETGVPDVGSFLELLLIVNTQDQYYFKQALLTKQLLPGPIVVHGDVGIGRTAVFYVADLCLYQILHTATVSVPLMVLKARQQRRSSISTLNHYMFLNSLSLSFWSSLNQILQFSSNSDLT
nr:PTP [Cotesia vestalis bracovirus]